MTKLNLICVWDSDLFPPLGIGYIYSYLKTKIPHQVPSELIICTDCNKLYNSIHNKKNSIILHSCYLWNTSFNLKLAAEAKKTNPNCITIFGGPNIPSGKDECLSFLKTNTQVDFLISGEGEEACLDLITNLSTIKRETLLIPNISYLTSDTLIHTPQRHSDTPPDTYPSPYLNGLFDSFFQFPDKQYMVISGSRGCPNQCTFCCWGKSTRLKKFSTERVMQEIDYFSQKGFQRSLFLADANFGILERDLKLAEYISEQKKRTSFPKSIIICYSMTPADRIVKIMKAFQNGEQSAPPRIALQTRDRKTLNAIGRQHFKNEKADKLCVKIYDELAIAETSGSYIWVDLMMALPGSTKESFFDDLRYYYETPIMLFTFPTIALVNSELTNQSYVQKYGLKFDSNRYIIKTSTISEEDLEKMSKCAFFFNTAQNYGIFRYIFIWLQVITGKDLFEILELLCDDYERYTFAAKYPRLASVYYSYFKFKYKTDLPHPIMISDQCYEYRLNNKWRDLFYELIHWAEGKFKINNKHEYSCILEIQSLLMPDASQNYPIKKRLEYDVVKWYKDFLTGNTKQLSSYPHGLLTISDPLGHSKGITFRSQGWELDSELMQVRKTTGFNVRFRKSNDVV